MSIQKRSHDRRKEFAAGFKSVLRAFSFVAENKLWHFYLYPFILDIVLAASLFAFVLQWSGDVSIVLGNWIGLDNIASTDQLSFWTILQTAAKFSIQILVWLFTFLLYYSIRKNILVLLSSPMMSVLSSRVEALTTGIKTDFDMPQFVRDLTRSALLSVRNLVVEIGIGIVIFCASLFIGLLGGPLALIALPLLSIAGFLVSAYYFGSSLLDYSHERNKLSIARTLRYNRERRNAVIGIGAAFNMLLWIPVVGVCLAIVLGTTGATRWYLAQSSSHQ